jgi:predicted secreted protein
MEERIGTLIVCCCIILLFYIVALGLIFADLWAGVRKAKQRGEYKTSVGLKRTVGKINKYFAMHFAMTLVDAVQISLLYMLYHEYGYDIPMLPVFTLIGVLYEAYVEITSIMEPADIKERKQQEDFKRLLQQALSDGGLRERVIKIIEDSKRDE